METKKLILDFIKKEKLAVISTVGEDSKPESAVLEFGETSNLELIFDTFITSRKYKNLKTNKNVSFVIGWDENITVQYEGIATELSGTELKKYQRYYWDKNPKAQRWEDRDGITYFKVVPTWIRYSDLNESPWKILEVSKLDSQC
jgi:general stress protein 26